MHEASESKRPRADIVVGGRFHSDRLAMALDQTGFEVHLWTTFPKHRLRRARPYTHSFIFPEILYRVGRIVGLENRADLCKIRWFGRRTAQALAATAAPRRILIGWSSFSLESFRSSPSAIKVLVRDSFHIEEQMHRLETSYRHLGLPPVDRREVVFRELREYELADRIIVLSRTARDSFVARGIDPEKIFILPLGIDREVFSPPASRPRTRQLKCLYVGNVSVRKGSHLLIDLFQRISPERFQLTVVGSIESALKKRLRQAADIKVLPPVSQTRLATILSSHDLFLFPTLEDGFGQVLIEAMACGCVPIVSSGCGSGELVRDGVDGWRIGEPDTQTIYRALETAEGARTELPAMSRNAIASARLQSWKNYDRRILELIHSFDSPRAPQTTQGAHR